MTGGDAFGDKLHSFGMRVRIVALTICI
jgi:hypothetical protein